MKHENQTDRKRLLCGPARDTPGNLLSVSETTFTAYLHSVLKIQDQMLVVNDSCNMSWTDGNRISSKYSGTPARTLLSTSRSPWEMKQYQSPHLVILDELS